MSGKDEAGRVSGMRLSMKSDYALRVLFTLVEERGRGPVPIRELAEQNDVPKRFLEHIMLDLKRQGWEGRVYSGPAPGIDQHGAGRSIVRRGAGADRLRQYVTGRAVFSAAPV